MNETIYRLGLDLVRLTLAVPPLAWALGLISRVWGRHHKLLGHMRTLHFDGVVDGGANIGEFAALVRFALPKADLVCVEPHPDSAAHLRERGYRVVEAALWRESTRLRLVQPTSASTSCTVLAVDAPKLEGTWEVDAVRLDSLALKGSRILIKLDLQGAEAMALEGMGALWDRTAALLLEMPVGPSKPSAKLEEMLRARGYFDYSTTNEIVESGRVVEADKLWLRCDLTGDVPCST